MKNPGFHPLVCFDLGGVVVRLVKSFEEACAHAGVPYRGLIETAQKRSLDEDHGSGRITDEAWATRMSAESAGRYSDAELLRIHDAWIRGEYPNVGRVVDELHRSGIRTACLSNTTEGHWRRMIHESEGVPLPGPAEFPAVAALLHKFASHRIGIVKPASGAYAHVERATETAPRDIFFFDDTSENIVAAQQRGWRAWRIDPLGDPAAQVRHALESARVLD